MSMPVLQVGLLAAGVFFLTGGAVLALIASRIAASGRAAQAEADIRLAASQELAVEVKRLADKVEQSLAARDAAVENAFLRHNEACMASAQAAHGACGAGQADEAAGNSAGAPHHSADLAASMSDHDDHKKHHAANDEDIRPSFFARLFRRYP
ncbi:MAG: hypothetical protein U5J99_12190 [Parvularculaceae bacterium]|nr:hypothetical protein [Parvularculaceae bacterium]